MPAGAPPPAPPSLPVPPRSSRAAGPLRPLPRRDAPGRGPGGREPPGRTPRPRRPLPEAAPARPGALGLRPPRAAGAAPCRDSAWLHAALRALLSGCRQSPPQRLPGNVPGEVESPTHRSVATRAAWGSAGRALLPGAGSEMFLFPCTPGARLRLLSGPRCSSRPRSTPRLSRTVSFQMPPAGQGE